MYVYLYWQHSVGESRRELEKYQATVKECESKRNHWQRELDKLQIHRLPDETEAQTLPTLTEQERWVNSLSGYRWVSDEEYV